MYPDTTQVSQIERLSAEVQALREKLEEGAQEKVALCNRLQVLENDEETTKSALDALLVAIEDLKIHDNEASPRNPNVEEVSPAGAHQSSRPLCWEATDSEYGGRPSILRRISSSPALSKPRFLRPKAFTPSLATIRRVSSTTNLSETPISASISPKAIARIPSMPDLARPAAWKPPRKLATRGRRGGRIERVKRRLVREELRRARSLPDIPRYANLHWPLRSRSRDLIQGRFQPQQVLSAENDEGSSDGEDGDYLEMRISARPRVSQSASNGSSCSPDTAHQLSNKRRLTPDCDAGGPQKLQKINHMLRPSMSKSPESLPQTPLHQPRKKSSKPEKFSFKSL